MRGLAVAALALAALPAGAGCRVSLLEQADAAQSLDGQGGTVGSGGVLGSADCVVTVVDAPLQRLTRAQYQASVQAALPGLAWPPLDLPADGAAGPFASNSALTVGDLELAQYAAAAAALAQAAAPMLTQIADCSLGEAGSNCLGRFSRALGARLYRRALSDDEAKAYAALGQRYLGENNPQGARNQVATAMLQSPNFLYRPEVGEADPTEPGERRLAGWELAVRLAFFLTGGPPDAALSAAVAAGALDDPNLRREQVERLVASDAFAGQLASWARQWLAIPAAASLTKDPALFPGFDAKLAAAIDGELSDEMRLRLAEDGASFRGLMTATTTRAAPNLAAFYGATSDANGVVQLGATQRAGLLTQAAFLAGHAHANQQTSTVLRGKVVRQNLLCQNMPAPPPNIPALPPTIPPGLTARQVFALHEANGTCAACHQLMDPLGLAFEPFDNIGRYRAQDNGSAIDPSGQLSTPNASATPFADARQLAAALVTNPDAQGCLVRQVFRFATERAETDADACSLAHLGVSFAAAGGSLRQLMAEVALSAAMTRPAAAARGS